MCRCESGTVSYIKHELVFARSPSSNDVAKNMLKLSRGLYTYNHLATMVKVKEILADFPV